MDDEERDDEDFSEQIAKMSDARLWSELRKAKGEVEGGWDMLMSLRGDMAQYYCEQGIDCAESYFARIAEEIDRRGPWYFTKEGPVRVSKMKHTHLINAINFWSRKRKVCEPDKKESIDALLVSLAEELERRIAKEGK